MDTKLPTIKSHKKSSFFVAWFLKNSTKSWNFMASCRAGVIRMFIWFSKNVPHKAPTPFIQMVPRWNECLLRWIHYQEWPPILSRSRIKQLEYIFIFALNLWSRNLFLFLEISTKFKTTKMSETQVHSFHANADIKAKFTFLEKCIHRWKHS